MPNLIQLILEPLSYPFMVRGLAAAVMVGIVCSLVGTYVVLRGMAFFGDALAHAILPGVAVGYLVSGSAQTTLFWWALAAAVLTSIGIGAVSKGAQIKEDTAIGIVFAGMFALGIALISTMRSYTVDLVHFLFGNVLGVTSADLVLTAIWSLIVVAMGEQRTGGHWARILGVQQIAIGGLDKGRLRHLWVDLLRSGAGRDAAPARQRIALPAADPDRRGHRRLPANRRHRSDAGYVGDTAGHRLSADAPAAQYDGAGCGHRCCIGGDRAVPLLLRQRGLRRGDRPGLHGVLPARPAVLAPPRLGMAGAPTRGGLRRGVVVRHEPDLSARPG